MPAPIAPSAAPVARPWMIRAPISAPTPPAVAYTTIDRIWTARAASSTGRRPIESDSRPSVSSAARTATA